MKVEKGLVVLMAPPGVTSEVLEEMCRAGGRLGMPILVVPHGWTQAQVDEAAVQAEREACAQVAEKFVATTRQEAEEADREIAALIRARGAR